MLTFPNIDPVALQVGPIAIHWYGLMYLGGFTGGYYLAMKRAMKPNSGWTQENVSDMIFYGAMGVILGARFGYVFFYNFAKFLDDPIMLFKVWEGGMSFHGGMLGVALAMLLYSIKVKKHFFDIMDFGAPIVPIGLGLGRIGNFIGGELWGRTTEVPWGMVFPGAGELARHPSQLYQFSLEGVALFCILWIFSRKPRPRRVVMGMFLIWYGIFRCVVELFRQPDAHLGYIAFDWLTMGQLLSLPMIFGGLAFVIYGYRVNVFAPTTVSASSVVPGSSINAEEAQEKSTNKAKKNSKKSKKKKR
ncbi:MAG: prolipoprotein diacylglyceryl transferase [Pseudomonadales bacterium]|nr:prolipoprotein diacylglyceryl transferase [Pseudomonadales bacterium]